MALASHPATSLPFMLPARRQVVCQAVRKPQVDEITQRAPAVIASLVAAALLSGAIVPEEALAARSGGRVGGSSFSSRSYSSRSSGSSSLGSRGASRCAAVTQFRQLGA